MTSRGLLGVAVSVGLAMPAVGLAVVPQPGTAPFAAPARGSATVAVVERASGRFMPTPGMRVFTVFARTPAGVPPTRVRLLMTAGPAPRRCARSFAADRGTPLPLRRALVTPGGYLTASSAPRNWTRLGTSRFCVWITTDPTRRTTPRPTDLRFVDAAMGLVAAPFATREPAQVMVASSSTHPYRLASTDACFPGVGYPDATARDGRSLFSIVTVYGAGGPCGRSITTTTTESIRGALTVSLSETEAAGHVIRHAGDACVFLDVPVAAADARTFVTAQGCRVGAVRRVPKQDVSAGAAWRYTVNGARAELVPTGTRVDIVVNAQP